MRKGKIIFLSFLTLVLLLPTQVFAAIKIDTAKPSNLSIVYQDDGKPLIDVKFDIYQIATVDQDFEYSLTDIFGSYNVDIRGEKDDEWNQLAYTLVGYAIRDSIKPSYTHKTNNNGIIDLKNIKQGLYLVVGSSHEQGGYIYDVDPFIVQLPCVTGDELIYDVKAYPKNQRKVDEKIDINVVKCWYDEGFEKQRPTEVIVQLLCNDKVYDTVKLNKENNWRYSWKNLDPKATWYVVEKEYIEYSATIEKKGNTFLIYNTYIYKVPPPPPLDETGVLWWPVPVLIAGGLFFVVLGVLQNKKGESNHEI